MYKEVKRMKKVERERKKVIQKWLKIGEIDLKEDGIFYPKKIEKAGYGRGDEVILIGYWFSPFRKRKQFSLLWFVWGKGTTWDMRMVV